MKNFKMITHDVRSPILSDKLSNHSQGFIVLSVNQIYMVEQQI